MFHMYFKIPPAGLNNTVDTVKLDRGKLDLVTVSQNKLKASRLVRERLIELIIYLGW